MKHCPACHSQYTDETLNFCLQDGTPMLDATIVQQSSIDTVAFSNPLTADAVLRTREMNFNPPKDWDKTQSLKDLSDKRTAGRSEVKKSSSSNFVFFAGSLLLLAAVSVGGWFYFSNQNKTPAQNSIVSSTSPAEAEKPPLAEEQNPTENPVLEKTAQREEQANVNQEQVKKEIFALIEEWKKLAESKNLSEYANKYAETVDYYEKPGAKLADVRAEMQKALTSYDRIHILLSNIKIAVSEDGKKATAVFDKEWDYENSENLSEGKAHAKLHFQKIGEQWKITGEKFLEIYDLEN